MNTESYDRNLRIVAVAGLAVGSILGMAGSFVQAAGLRAMLWNIDGTALVVAAAVLALIFLKRGQDLVAAGCIVFAVAEGVVMTSNGIDLAVGAPQFASGISLWAAALAMISAGRVFPAIVRLLGIVAAVLFAITAFRIFGGEPLHALSKPLPSLAYPVFVATMVGWIWTILRIRPATG